MSAPYRFDRYRNGRLMAEGIKVNKENCLKDAIKVAARLADHGDVLVYDVAIAAALAKMGAVQVKPLVWTAKGYAQTPFGKYLVVREDWSGQEDFWFVCFAGKPYGKCGEHSSEEAAKAAAQADYEARILAAIEPAPVSVREAARVLLDEWRHGEGPLGDLCCYSLDEDGTMQPDIDGRWVEFTQIEAALFRAIAEGKD